MPSHDPVFITVYCIKKAFKKRIQVSAGLGLRDLFQDIRKKLSQDSSQGFTVHDPELSTIIAFGEISPYIKYSISHLNKKKRLNRWIWKAIRSRPWMKT